MKLLFLSLFLLLGSGDPCDPTIVSQAESTAVCEKLSIELSVTASDLETDYANGQLGICEIVGTNDYEWSHAIYGGGIITVLESEL